MSMPSSYKGGMDPHLRGAAHTKGTNFQGSPSKSPNPISRRTGVDSPKHGTKVDLSTVRDYDRNIYAIVDKRLYQYTRFLGRGGCGDVFRVTEVLLGPKENTSETGREHESSVKDDVQSQARPSRTGGDGSTSASDNRKFLGQYPILGYGRSYACKKIRLKQGKNQKDYQQAFLEAKSLERFKGDANIVQIEGFDIDVIEGQTDSETGKVINS